MNNSKFREIDRNWNLIYSLIFFYRKKFAETHFEVPWIVFLCCLWRLYIGFALIGNGCASVLNTHSSNGNNESSENTKYKYCKKGMKKESIWRFKVKRKYENWGWNSLNLQDFGQEKALLSVVLVRMFGVNVVNSTESTIWSAVSVDCLRSIPGPIAVFLIMRQTP